MNTKLLPTLPTETLQHTFKFLETKYLNGLCEQSKLFYQICCNIRTIKITEENYEKILIRLEEDIDKTFLNTVRKKKK
jgi:hypothetical protein